LPEEEKKKSIEKATNAKKAIQKNLPKYKVDTSVTLNGVDFIVAKGGGAFTYYGKFYVKYSLAIIYV
jgi:hypothetical protein